MIKISYGEKDNDPGAGVVILAVGVHQADGVKEGRVQRPHVCELCRLESLIFSFFNKTGIEPILLSP